MPPPPPPTLWLGGGRPRCPPPPPPSSYAYALSTTHCSCIAKLARFVDLTLGLWHQANKAGYGRNLSISELFLMLVINQFVNLENIYVILFCEMNVLRLPLVRCTILFTLLCSLSSVAFLPSALSPTSPLALPLFCSQLLYIHSQFKLCRSLLLNISIYSYFLKTS